MTTRLLALTLSATLLLAVAPGAHADYDSDLTGNTITLTGDGDSDSLAVYQEGGLLRHNLFPADASYAANTDWDNTTAGNQFIAAFAPNLQVNVDAGDGTDTFSVGRDDLPSNSASFILGTVEFDGGAGNDFASLVTAGDETPRTVTLTSASLAVAGGGARLEWTEDTEYLTAALGPGADTIAVNGSANGTIAALFGQGGDDTFTSTGLAPLNGGVSLVGGAGTDSFTVNEPANSGQRSYSVRDTSIERDLSADVFFDNTLEKLTLNTGSDADTITKTGSRPITVNSGGGNDQVATRDSVADTVDCGAGDADFALTDPLDNLVSGCETSDRTLATPPAAPPADGGGGGSQQPPAALPAADTKAPATTLTGVRKSLKRASFLKGVPVKVATDEPASIAVRLLGSTGKVTLSRTYNVTLAQGTLPLGTGARTLKLKPSKRLVGRARRFNAQVEVVATDAAGNRSTKRFNLKVGR